MGRFKENYLDISNTYYGIRQTRFRNDVKDTISPRPVKIIGIKFR